MTWGAIASTLDLLGEPRGSEIFASGPEVISATDDTMWGEDANYISAPLGKLQTRVPVRARRVSPGALYEIITVVGKRAFSATNDPRTAEFDLVGRSLALAPQAEVHFATITWAIDDAGATPVRLNTDPEETELRYAWNEVADALCEDLIQ